MAHIKSGSLPTENTNRVTALAKEGLRSIAETLASEDHFIFTGIHEIYIMQQQAEQWNPVFTYADEGREVDIFDVWALFERIREVQHGSVISLEGQEGQSFDFMVMILHKGVEHFVFGNNIHGTLEDLEKNEQWLIAKSQFVALAAALVKAIAES